MAGVEKTQGQAVEEILASIRRIISDGAEGGATASSDMERPFLRANQRGEDTRLTVLEGGVNAFGVEEQLSDLSSVLPEEKVVSIGAMSPDNAESRTSFSERSAAENQLWKRRCEPVEQSPKEEALSGMGEATVSLQDFSAPSRAAPENSGTGISGSYGEHLMKNSVSAIEGAERKKPLGHEDLISSRGAAAIRSSFSDLENSSRMVCSDASVLEELVLRALYPMLQNWLDQNLRDLVENVVRDEMKRVVRKGA